MKPLSFGCTRGGFGRWTGLGPSGLAGGRFTEGLSFGLAGGRLTDGLSFGLAGGRLTEGLSFGLSGGRLTEGLLPGLLTDGFSALGFDGVVLSVFGLDAGRAAAGLFLSDDLLYEPEDVVLDFDAERDVETEREFLCG